MSRFSLFSFLWVRASVCTLFDTLLLMCFSSSAFVLYVPSQNKMTFFIACLLMCMLRSWWGISAFDHLRKVNQSLIAPPSETAVYHVGLIYGRTCQYPRGFISWGYRRGEYFSSSTRGRSEKGYNCGWSDWMVGFEPTTHKPMVCRRRHFLRNS